MGVFDFVDANYQVLDLFLVAQTHLLQLAALLPQRGVFPSDFLAPLPQPRHRLALPVLDGNGLS